MKNEPMIPGQTGSPQEQKLLTYLDTHKERLFDLLRQLISHNTETTSPAAGKPTSPL